MITFCMCAPVFYAVFYVLLTNARHICIQKDEKEILRTFLLIDFDMNYIY
jgi:uncharacterized membrane protein